MLKNPNLFLILFVVSAITSICSIAHKTCYTPNYKKGECVNVNDCGSLSNILNDTSRNRKKNLFLRDSACGFENRTLQVCCGKYELVSNCRTPNDKPGICIPYFNCPSLYDKNDSSLLRRLKGNKTIPFLQFRCENEKYHSYKFCCDDEKLLKKINDKNLLPSRTECGRENQKLKFKDITDGETDVYQYPWMVRVVFVNIETFNEDKQSGTLINSRYVLTAAHYYSMYNILLPVAVILKMHNTTDYKNCSGNNCDNGFLKIPIEKIIIHTDYDENTFKNNIALIRMSESVKYTDSVRPICLPQMNVVEESTQSVSEVLTSGWLRNNHIVTNGSNVEKKFQFKVSIVPNDLCEKNYEKIRKGFLLPEHFCAEQSKDPSCQLQSTPLMRPKNDQFELIGISLLGTKPCIGKEFPDVYLNIFLFIDWIKENLKP